MWNAGIGLIYFEGGKRRSWTCRALTITSAAQDWQ